jgi:nicotinamidase-related amidase
LLDRPHRPPPRLYGPEIQAKIVMTDRTALLIVDPYNDFMRKGGKLYEATKQTAEAVGFYANMRKLIPAIRAARIQVIIVPHYRWRERDYKR